MPNTKSKPSRKNLKLSEAIATVVDLARAVRTYWETELPKRHPNYPVMNPGEDPLPPPPEEKRLAKFLAGLPDDMVFQIGLVMYLGRGDFGTHELRDHYQTLQENFGRASELASQLTEKAPLAEYLVDGLAELDRNGIDVDHLPLRPAKAHR